MSVGELIPNISVTEDSKRDSRSILFLKRLFPLDLVDCRQLQEGGSLSNIDGYLDILCPDGTAKEKVVVQVKHLTYPEHDGKVFYDIPKSIYAYAERHKGELVIFIACDYDHGIFYWRNIDEASIEEFRNGSDNIRTKERYYFQEKEKCSENNVAETIDLWRELYNRRMESIKDEKMLANQFAAQQKIYFNAVSSELHGAVGSHINRYQVDEIRQWIGKDSREDDNRICLLAGDAGVGKSAVLKDLISLSKSDNIAYLCIKADSIDDNGNPVTLEKMLETLAYYSTEADEVVLIVDQIDALSQCLTSDRRRLNMMMTMLSSLNDWPNIRAVVSCRKYDLEYDSALNSLKTKSTLIEIGELTDEEVAIALNNLEKGLDKRVDHVTAKMLRNVQMLDSFSILFHRNKSKINFNSRIELYDALWDNIICDSSSRQDVKMRECVMYKIAELIRQSGTLNPQFVPTSDHKLAYEYLASNSLIRREGSAVSFFHQSFYEYTLARDYSEKGRLFVSDIKKEIQGLELRSTVKAILDFNRGHNIANFVEESRGILVDPDIRLHLKLLTLSVLAFVDSPSRGEKNLIVEICRKDRRMLECFLRGVNAPCWFPTIRNILCGIMPEQKRSDKLFFPVVQCLSRYAFINPEEVYGMINMIQDRVSRLFALAYVQRGHNDYSKTCVLAAYNELKPQNDLYRIDQIQDAIKTNVAFALHEIEELLRDYIISENFGNKHNEYELVEELCPRLCAEYPKEMLGILHRCICETVRKTAQQSIYIFSTTKIFDATFAKDCIGKLLKMYEDLLIRYSSDGSTVRPLVEELMSLHNETTLSMAFAAMAVAPGMHDGLIRSILNDNVKIGGYLHGDVGFFFLRLLRVWYDTLDGVETVWYQRLLLSYRSEFDFKYDSERRWCLLLCPHLWRDKWKLICNTLPEDSFIPEMKRCFQELMRRFGSRDIVERCDHSITAALYCGGVVGNDTYARWPISNWLSSFLKLSEYKWREGRNPISLRVHAEAFEKCVAANPKKYYNFVFDISAKTDVSDMYKIAGLKGLLVGGVDPYALWVLAEKYITEDFARNDCYTFSQLAEYYIKEENSHVDAIMGLCKTLVLSPFSEPQKTLNENESNRDKSIKARDLLNMAINSYQGRAAELLVHMCRIPLRRPIVYSFFTDNSTIMHECVRTLPLYYLNAKDYYDAELYFPLMRSILSGMGSEALYPCRCNTVVFLS